MNSGEFSYYKIIYLTFDENEAKNNEQEIENAICSVIARAEFFFLSSFWQL